MNLIEAWHKANEGQRIQNRYGLTFHKTIDDNFYDMFKSAWMTTTMALDDDWEIKKKTKKEVFEGVEFRHKGDGTVIWSFEGRIPTNTPNITMTLEWEE